MANIPRLLTASIGKIQNNNFYEQIHDYTLFVLVFDKMIAVSLKYIFSGKHSKK